MPESNHNHIQDNRKRRRKRSVGATVVIRFFQVIGTLILVGVLTASILCCYGAIYIKNAVMPKAVLDMSAYTMDENSVIYYYDDNGLPVKLAELSGMENRQRVEYEDIPQDLIDAYVAIEDKRFWEHKGVDWYRTGGAVVNMFFSMRNTFGGSTITQQLVKNVTEYDDGTVTRKIMEIFTALDLEKRYSKEQILTWYLNEIYLGNGCYGVQAASKLYFGKDVSELSLAECASLAGITNNPSLYSPYGVIEVIRYRCGDCGLYSLSYEDPCEYCGADNFGNPELWDARRWNKARQETILKNMADPKISPNGAYITEEEYKAALNEDLIFARDVEQEEENTSTSTAVYSWYVDAVISEVINDLVETQGWSDSHARKAVYSGGLSIFVPYDPKVQAAVDQVYNDRSNLNKVSKTGQQMTSAITVVDNSTGYVVAMSGGIGEKTVNRGWNNALATRQPGSSIKPLAVYSPALEMGLITPATVIDDNPRLLNDNPWPVNAPSVYKGLTTVQSAVVRSVNTIAVNVLDMITPRASFDFVTGRYGITSLVEEMVLSNGQVVSDVVDLGSLSMGGLTKGMSTFEMAAAYATFPRNGAYTEATTYLLVKDINGNVIMDNKPKTEYVIKESTAYYINTMLTAAVNVGTGYDARLSGQVAAGKTGTTNDVYDLWFAGYTPYYTAVVWTGYPINENMGNIANPSVSLWKKVMTQIHENLESANFYTPEGLKNVTVCLDCGKLATEDCERDTRGKRTQTFSLMKEDAPVEYCTCHVPVVICTDCPILDEEGKETGAYLLAGEFCPEESVREVTMVEYQRELVKDTVVVQDRYALIGIYDTMENPYCEVHAHAPEPDEPENPGLPEDPEENPDGEIENPGDHDTPETDDPSTEE